jgi:small subunit ribosomal protein S2
VAIVQVKDLIEAGVHFGHRASRWNPKMRPYIYGKRNLIHIIDLRETVRGLLRAYRFLSQLASKGSLVLFVGNTRQSKETRDREAARCLRPSGR